MKASFRAVFLAGLLCAGCNGVAPTNPSSVGSGHDGSSQIAAPSARAVPFNGKLEGSQTITPLQPPFALVNASATGTATHLGRFTVTFPHTVNFATASATGTMTFTAANGDVLIATFTGQAQQGAIVSIVEHATITGGTGRFATASGTFTVERQFNPATGTTEGSFAGSISSIGAGNP